MADRLFFSSHNERKLHSTTNRLSPLHAKPAKPLRHLLKPK